MTNEDIETLVKRYYGAPLPGMMPLALELIAQAKAEAYDEAAQATLSLETTERSDYDEGYSDALRDAAGRIRALKDSLVQEIVS